MNSDGTPDSPPANNLDDATEASSFGASEPTDGRKQYEWKSKYPPEALSTIRIEATALAIIFVISLFLIFATWAGLIEQAVLSWFGINAEKTLRLYCYIAFSGLSAGTIFSIKFLYHVVARGFWHIDRQLWRFLSPLISMGVAFFVGALLHANLISGGVTNELMSPPKAISIGFVAGYFSDAAIAKMLEIAGVIFGTSAKSSNRS